MSRWKIVLIVVVVVIAGLIAYRVIGHHGHRRFGMHRQAAIPVTAVKVARENVPVYLTALGTVQAYNTVTVVPQVSGQLIAIDFKEGSEIKKGDVIAQIAPSTYRAALEQAQGKEAQDKALLGAAEYLASSYEHLSKNQFVAAQTLQAQQQTVQQDKAAIQADKAAVDSAQVQLGYTTIRAPIDGIAGLRLVDVGNVVGPSTTGGIVVLTQIHPISVIFNLPQQNLEAVRRALEKGTLQAAALDRDDSKVIANGTLKVISNEINTDTSTFQLKAEFANKDDVLWPGQFVNVRLQLGAQENALVIPAQAIESGPDGDYAFVVQPDKTVKMQPVVSGIQAGAGNVVVRKGLSAGQEVVTQGQFLLKQGSKVNPIAPGQTPAVPGASPKGKARRGYHHG